jgi:hypothetical protein
MCEFTQQMCEFTQQMWEFTQQTREFAQHVCESTQLMCEFTQLMCDFSQHMRALPYAGSVPIRPTRVVRGECGHTDASHRRRPVQRRGAG